MLDELYKIIEESVKSYNIRDEEIDKLSLDISKEIIERLVSFSNIDIKISDTASCMIYYNGMEIPVLLRTTPLYNIVDLDVFENQNGLFVFHVALAPISKGADYFCLLTYNFIPETI